MLKFFYNALFTIVFVCFAAHADDSSLGGEQQNAFFNFIPFILVFLIFYFVMLRPQKKKFEEEEKMRRELKKGEEVYTKSGLIGTIHGMNDTIITLEVDTNTKVKVFKSQIAGTTKSLQESNQEKKGKEKGRGKVLENKKSAARSNA